MPLTRKPAISEARVGDRVAQTAITNIRQRIEQIETAFNALQSSSAQPVTDQKVIGSIQLLQNQITALKAQLDAFVASGLGPTSLVTADGTIAIGDAVYATSINGFSTVDPLNPLAVYATVGVAETAGVTGGTFTLRRFGHLLLGASTFDVGRAVYAAPGGGLTQSPNYGDVAIPVGVANTVNSIYVMPGWPALLTEGFDPFYEDFLPVTQLRLRDEFTQNVNNALVEVFDDASLDSGVRLAIVNANGGDVVVVLPSGLIDGGFQTREITIYRRDQGSGVLGTNVVSVLTVSGQTIDNTIYETTLADGEARHFLAVGAEGWIEA